MSGQENMISSSSPTGGDVEQSVLVEANLAQFMKLLTDNGSGNKLINRDMSIEPTGSRWHSHRRYTLTGFLNPHHIIAVLVALIIFMLVFLALSFIVYKLRQIRRSKMQHRMSRLLTKDEEMLMFSDMYSPHKTDLAATLASVHHPDNIKM